MHPPSLQLGDSMAKPKITKADVKKAASKAARAAAEKGKKLLAAAGEKAGKANKRLREMKHRRLVDGVEVFFGGVAAGAAHGAGVYLGGEVDEETGEESMVVPVGVPAGVVALGAGVALKSYDLQALGLGSLTFGAGRMAEDFVKTTLEEAEQEDAG